jgi:hypothetical protein
VRKYCLDLALTWLKEGAPTFERLKPRWYTDAWIQTLPSKLAAALVLDQDAPKQACEMEPGRGQREPQVTLSIVEPISV